MARQRGSHGRSQIPEGPLSSAPEPRIPLADGWVDLETGATQRGTVRGRLTGKEVAVLRYLVHHADRAVTLTELHAEVWGHAPSVVSRAAYHTLGRLRRKIEVDPANPEHVRSTYADGYRWVGPATTDGRDAERREIRTRLARHAAVCLVGPGGIGKTWLARSVIDRDQDRFVDLSVARDAAGVAHTIAAALDVSIANGVDGLILALGTLRSVVVFDNVEQVLGPVLELVARCAGPRFLLTSRVAPRRPGVEEVEIGGLEAHAARALLRARAGDAVASPTFDALLAHLEGNPLALELAAARLGLFSVEQLLQMPTGLASTLDWSWGLLSAAERRGLARCSLFERPFTADRAARLLAPDREPLATLGALRAASLLAGAERDGRVTLSVPAGLRDALRERLVEVDDPVAASLQHAEILAEGPPAAEDLPDLLAAAEAALAGGRGDLAAALVLRLTGLPGGLLTEAELLRLLRRARSALGPDEALLWRLDLAESSLLGGDAGVALLRDLLRRASTPTEQALAHHRLAAELLTRQAFDDGFVHLRLARERWAALGEDRRLDELTHYEGGALIDRGEPALALACFRAATHPALRIRALNGAGVCLLALGRLVEAEGALREGLALAEGSGGRIWIGALQMNLGNVAVANRDLERAERWYTQALATHRSAGFRQIIPGLHNNLGTLALVGGAFESAREHATIAVGVARALGLARVTAEALVLLGVVEEGSGRYGAARDCHREALEVAPWHPEVQAEARRGLAMVAAAGGDVPGAMALLDAVANSPATIAVRAHVTLLAGDRDGARALVASIGADPTDPLHRYRIGQVAAALATG